MQPFVAQIIYRIDCDGAPTDQYEEEWRLIFSKDDNSALYEAKKVAENEAVTLIDRHGRTICWKLIAVKDLQPVNLENGTLLFSSVKEAEPIAAPVWIR